MVDSRSLRGLIAREGYSQTKVAKEIGMSPRTFYAKMKKGVFGSDEIEKMISLLNIENPAGIFFAGKVTSQVTNKEGGV
jgi:DNA-binding XRE family transcriptional regulator